jgi:hypothetical protein
MKLNVLKLASAIGIVSALSMALLVIDGMYMARGLRAISILGGVFPGYTVSWQGAGLGLVYGFICAYIYAAVTVWLYDGLLVWKGLKLKKAKPVAKKKRK